MEKFKITKTKLNDLLIIEPMIFGDKRGFFLETYNKKDFNNFGLEVEFVQDNHSKSKKNVLRGLHYQKKNTQGKLVRVSRGKVWDVAVDLRNDSTTFGKWYGIELSEENKKMFYIPEGFAHGFLTLEDDTEFQYKCTNFYDPDYEDGIIWNDELIDIKWPFLKYGLKIEKIIISEKDKKLKKFDKKTIFLKRSTK